MTVRCVYCGLTDWESRICSNCGHCRDCHELVDDCPSKLDSAIEKFFEDAPTVWKDESKKRKKEERRP